VAEETRKDKEARKVREKAKCFHIAEDDEHAEPDTATRRSHPNITRPVQDESGGGDSRSANQSRILKSPLAAGKSDVRGPLRRRMTTLPRSSSMVIKSILQQLVRSSKNSCRGPKKSPQGYHRCCCCYCRCCCCR
jgi:hypothetical protein